MTDPKYARLPNMNVKLAAKRKFGNRNFRFIGAYFSKTAAQTVATDLQMDDYRTRVVPTRNGGYAVYMRA